MEDTTIATTRTIRAETPRKEVLEEGMTISSSHNKSSTGHMRPVLYSFSEARKMARGYGFESKQEYLDYDCAGAYNKLPRNPDEVWPQEWNGWEDWLGVCYKFEEGRTIARTVLQLQQPPIQTKEDYMSFFQTKNITDNNRIGDKHDSIAHLSISRLPFRPDLYYKLEWKGWEDWLGTK